MKDLVIVSVFLFFSFLQKIRILTMAIRLQNDNHPEIMQRNCKNPLMKFLILFYTALTVITIATFFLIKYDWYILANFFFAIPQIIFNIQKG
jgi:hypothetical protein